MQTVNTKSENTIKAYEFLKANPDQMFTIKEVAEALGLTSPQVLGGLVSLAKKEIVARHEIEIEGKPAKAYSILDSEVEFVMDAPKKMSDKAIQVIEYLKNGGDGQTHKEIADALGVAAVAVVGVVNSLVKKGLATREEVSVEMPEGDAKTLKTVNLTEEGRNYTF